MKGRPTLGWTDEKVTSPVFVGVGHGDHHVTGGGHLVLVVHAVVGDLDGYHVDVVHVGVGRVLEVRGVLKAKARPRRSPVAVPSPIVKSAASGPSRDQAQVLSKLSLVHAAPPAPASSCGFGVGGRVGRRRTFWASLSKSMVALPSWCLILVGPRLTVGASFTSLMVITYGGTDGSEGVDLSGSVAVTHLRAHHH